MDVFINFVQGDPSIANYFHDTISNKFYLAGNFSQVNGVGIKDFAEYKLTTSLTSTLSVVTTTTINNYGVDPSVVVVVYDVNRVNNSLIISKAHNAVDPLRYKLSEFNLGTSSLTTWNPTISGGAVKKIVVKNSKVYALGNFTSINGQARNGVARFSFPAGTLDAWSPLPGVGIDIVDGAFINDNLFIVDGAGSSKFIKLSIHDNSVIESPDIVFGNSSTSITVRDNKIYVSGTFSNRNNIACYDTLGNLLSWNPSEVTIIITKVMAYDDLIFAFGKDINDLPMGYAFDATTGVLKYSGFVRPPTSTVFSGTATIHKNRFISAYQTSFDYNLDEYCLPPYTPKFTQSQSTICGLPNVATYTVSSLYATSYTYSYSGTGVSFTGIGATRVASFSTTATTGTLTVTAYSDCGDAKSYATIINVDSVVPIANAGIDTTLTCKYDTISLQGNSPTPLVSFYWNGPTTYTFSGANALNVDTIGVYTLTVTRPSGCFAKDYLTVSTDTLKPIVNLPAGPYNLNCKQNFVALNGTTPNARCRVDWVFGTNQPTIHNYYLLLPASTYTTNPATFTGTGYYTQWVTDTINGCRSFSGLTIADDYTPPIVPSYFPLLTEINCFDDTLHLTAFSTTPNTTFTWTKISVTTFTTATVHLTEPGVFLIEATDTINGCSSSSASINITKNVTNTSIIAPTGIFELNCSYNSLVLTGSSNLTTATIEWLGPSSYTSTNPATITVAGDYVLKVTDTSNGCFSLDTTSVTSTNSLNLLSTNDTLICAGTNVSLATQVIGGQTPFNYDWQGLSLSNTLNVTSSVGKSIFKVMVTDNNGCVGLDSVIIQSPTIISDSIKSFKPCGVDANGQIQVYAFNGIAPYKFALGNATNFTSESVFNNLNNGEYEIYIKDSLGCIKSSLAQITSESELPAPDFIFTTNAFASDTIAAVEISLANPDTLEWILPQNFVNVSESKHILQFTTQDTGTFQITMRAIYGSCNTDLTKEIRIISNDTTYARQNFEQGIKSLVIFPNPNNGNFSYQIEFYKKQKVAIVILDQNSNELYNTNYIEEENLIFGNVNLTSPVNGNYFFRVVSEYDSQTVQFLITD